jgi:LacI family transcriptional regulator
VNATIQDVAAAAGVSVATVSRTLNGPERVSEPTRERVLLAVHDLDYRPNRAARSLRARASRVLGLIISDITNPFFTNLVRGVEDVAQRAGYSVVLANSDEDLAKEATYLEVAAAERMAGVVLSPASATGTSIRILREYGIPVVTIDRKLREAGIDSITIDNAAAARDATEHLIAAGCERIAVVTGPRRTSTATERLAGCRKALRAEGRTLDRAAVRYADYRVEGGYEATRDLLGGNPAPDGLLVANNLMTIGALAAVEQAGLRTPRDITMVGFDDMSWPLGGRPALTLVAQPTYDIGRNAAEILLRRVRGERLPPQRVVLPATLIPDNDAKRPSGEVRSTP